MNRKWLWPFVIVVAIAAAALWWNHRASEPPPPVPASTGETPAAAAPTEPKPAPKPAEKITPSGNYADDWMKHCAPLGKAQQDDCTKRLEAAYGKTDDAPVPKSH
jgi:hypothetical protein